MSQTFSVKTVATTPFEGQAPGTSGLRKKVTVVQQPHYLNNFVQAIFDALPQNELKGCTLVLGGDGRYYNNEAIQTILKMASANGVGKVLVGQNGIFSTPAVSACVRKRKTYGAIILTASHNPGGPNADFGIKYNISNGGPAPEAVTNAIFDITKKITQYKISDLPDVDLSKLGKHSWQGFEVEIIDNLVDYVESMKQIFDFPAIKALLARSDFKVLFDSLSGVTGPYVKHIFVDELGAPASCCMNAEPLIDFGGHHPDPNLTYAEQLVERMYSKTENIAFGAAWDGDGDRNMLLGKDFFVTPSDSVAIIAANATAIPYFKSGLAGVSRSMPTSQALDLVARHLNLPFYEVPTGWKFFGNLMDKYEKEQPGKGFVCGEESFGTGSAHIREKDGVWATLAWLNIIAAKNQGNNGKLVSVADIVKAHWQQFGRNYYSRYDYEEVDAKGAGEMMKHLLELQKTLQKGSTLEGFTIDTVDEFSYTDPVDGSVSARQGIRFIFSDGSRVVYRLSGTGSAGATVRVYLERYEADKSKLEQDTQEALAPLVKTALSISKIKEFTGRDKPTVIT
jgi:phosphoglucomutase